MFVTALYAGLLGLWLLALVAKVTQNRRRARVSLGDGGDPQLQRAIRGHANFAEHVPLALVMMALLESSRASIYLLHALGVTLLAARLLHGYALCFTAHFPFGRMAGATLTFVVILVAALACLYQGWRGHLVW